MTHRERFRMVLRREIPDRIPMVARLDLWYNAARDAGALPPELRGLAVHQIEARLGLGRSARFNQFFDTRLDDADVTEKSDGFRRQTALSFGGRTLTQTLLRTPEQERRGVSGHLVEYFAKTAEDYETLAALWERMRWEFHPEAFEKFSRDVGDDGLPLINLGESPIHHIMLRYAGYENFYLHLADFPEKIEGLLRVMEARYEELWRAAAACSAELVLHDAHWSTDMTPPPIFRRYFLPYHRRFARAMHAAGKPCGVHTDSDLRGLLEETPATGMDVADCFACAPLVRLTLAEARHAWADRVIVWGGFPSTLLMPFCPVREFRAYLDSFLAEIADGRAIIGGISDNLMPGTDWERFREVAERVTALRPATRT